MTHTVWSVASALTLMLTGCAAPASSGTVDRHVVPSSFTEVALEDFDVVSFLDVDLHTAIQTREAVESEFNTGYGHTGHLRWFFHAFDRKNLDFIVARFDAKDPSSPRYVAQRRLRVKRSHEAELALGVTTVVKEFDVAAQPAKVGMSRREVAVAVRGVPLELPRGSVPGSFDLLYPKLCVRFVEGKVAAVLRRDQCLR